MGVLRVPVVGTGKSAASVSGRGGSMVRALLAGVSSGSWNSSLEAAEWKDSGREGEEFCAMAVSEAWSWAFSLSRSPLALTAGTAFGTVVASFILRATVGWEGDVGCLYMSEGCWETDSAKYGIIVRSGL